MDKIRVFLVDSHVSFRRGMLTALSGEEDMEVVGEAGDAEDAFSQVQSLLPDVVLLDPGLSSASGLDLARQIRRVSPVISIVVVADYDDDEQFLLAIRAGAAGYLTKAVTNEELINTIKRVAQGEFPINESLLTMPQVALRVLREFQGLLLIEREVDPLISPLSNREIEILNCITGGNSNKEIASILKLSNQTVKNHVTSILRKLAANDRTHAVVLALRHGWVKIP